MEISVRIVSVDKMEATAITVMRCMLLEYAEENGIPFETAMLDFLNSNTYSVLFDFETGVWKEGPDYLRSLYEDEQNERL